MEKGFNYARFYTLLTLLPGADKETLVAQYTDGRTTSLREALRRQLRCRRSEVLKLMQQLGIDTTDWNRVDAFCKDVRIAGKAFRYISIDELEALAVKLRIIERKGGLKAHPQQPEQPTTAVRLQQTIVVVAPEKVIEN